jgi:hypothetical protein
MNTSDLAAFPAVCKALLDRPVFSTPTALELDHSAGTFALELPGVAVVLEQLDGDPQWLIDAFHLGGLMIRILPNADPCRITLCAAWEGQMTMVSGIPCA